MVDTRNVKKVSTSDAGKETTTDVITDASASVKGADDSTNVAAGGEAKQGNNGGSNDPAKKVQDVDKEAAAKKGISANMPITPSACDKEGSEPTNAKQTQQKTSTSVVGTVTKGTKRPREDLVDPVKKESTEKNNECTKPTDVKGKGPCADGYCRTPIAYLYDDIAKPISFLVAFYVDRVFHKTLLSVTPVRSFATIGMSDYPDNEQSMENDIYVEELVKSAVDAYMECGDDDDDDDDDDDELSLSSWMNKSVIPVGNVQGVSEIDKDNEIDMEVIVKSAVDAYMECDDNDDNFVTPLLRKSEAKMGDQVVLHAGEQRNDGMENWKMKVRSKAEMKITNALRSPFYEREVKVSNKLNPDERIMFYWLMTTYNTNEDKLVYDDDVVERLFFTTYPALYTIMNPTGGVYTDNNFNTFATNLDKEVREIPNFKWGVIDMVLFPFCVFKRDYAVCFCFHRKAVVVIDGSKDEDDREMRFNYGDIPDTLVWSKSDY
ncbi:hypothetical protein AAHA92_22234 [Salvia divinorum]|uniref:Ulp1 protease family, C-terminal catalytic domain-containing protein n=1 Tax=Salvia divinorum TaxID=28513 RepID=A0ABD1GNH0_SALDI